MTEISNKLYYVMKSIYRYQQIKSMPHAPSILLETESRILKDRLSSLDPDEVIQMVHLWPSFEEEYRVEEEIQNQKMDEELESFMNNLN